MRALISSRFRHPLDTAPRCICILLWNASFTDIHIVGNFVENVVNRAFADKVCDKVYDEGGTADGDSKHIPWRRDRTCRQDAGAPSGAVPGANLRGSPERLFLDCRRRL